MKLSEPPKENLRYYDVVNWLKANGFRAFTIRLFFERGVIEAHFVTPLKHAFYSATQIKEALNGKAERLK
jgi:hypothetical protein